MTRPEFAIFKVNGDTAGDDLSGVRVHCRLGGAVIVESEVPFAVGDIVAISLAGEEIVAQVVWSKGTIYAFEVLPPAAHRPAGETRAIGPFAGVRSEAATSAAATRRIAFGINLARLRHHNGLTLGDVARAVKVSKPTVWAWENGKAFPKQERLHLIAQALGVPVASLESLADAKHHASADTSPDRTLQTLSEFRHSIAEDENWVITL
jgi:transcriptional regulator with XRE-family HTH domain